MLRETAEPAPELAAEITALHLSRLQLTREQYLTRVTEQAAARAAFLDEIRCEELAPEARHDAEARYHTRWGRSTFKCPGCWLFPGLCVCGRLRTWRGRHQLAVFMHHKEWGRASNTGCLLRATLGAEAGIVDDETRLRAALAARPSVVLWPGEDALPASQLGRVFTPAQLESGLLVVAIDTTNCAKKMVKRIPAEVPRVAVSAEMLPDEKSLLYPIRKYDGPADDRVCTYEAVLAFLEEAGDLDGVERERLLHNLKMKVNNVLRNKCRKPAYSETSSAESDGEG